MIATELTDIVFQSKQGSISLASLGVHVDNQGVNTMFALPSYRDVNSVDWQEYDGEDVDCTNASVNPLPLQIKVFGTSSVVEKLVKDLRNATKDSEIRIEVKIKEGTFNNIISFSTKFTGATIGKMVIANDWELQHFYLTDEDSDYILTETDAYLMAGMNMKVLRRLTFATLTFTRHSDDEHFGLLADNLKGCQGIPQNRFTSPKFPTTNMPIELRRYHVSNRTAEQIDYFEFYNDLVFCYPLKGVIQGMKGIAESKTAYSVQTENMVGEVLETKNADKRRAKNLTIPLLVRSHSVTAIMKFLYEYKNFIHDTLKGGDMLYLHSETEGDFAIYPSGCNVRKAYIKDQPWVEIELQFVCYKEGFDFTTSTDGEAQDNPEPVLPPSPPSSFDPYKGIVKTNWQACIYGTNMYASYMTLDQYLALPDGSKKVYQEWEGINAKQGWSAYSQAVTRYPVGTLFFSLKQSKSNGASKYLTVVAMPTSMANLETIMAMIVVGSSFEGYTPTELTLVGVVNGCDLLSKNIVNWETKLQADGGLVGYGTVRVHSDIMTLYDNDAFEVVPGLTLTSSDDFDTLVNNIKLDMSEDPLKYLTSWGVSLII